MCFHYITYPSKTNAEKTAKYIYSSKVIFVRAVKESAMTVKYNPCTFTSSPLEGAAVLDSLLYDQAEVQHLVQQQDPWCSDCGPGTHWGGLRFSIMENDGGASFCKQRFVQSL